MHQLILKASKHLRCRAKTLAGPLSDISGGDTTLYRDMLECLDALDDSQSLKSLYASWQMVRGLEGYVRHEKAIFELTGKRKNTKFM